MEEPQTPSTSPFRHVVAATDFSEPAATGIAWARDLARTHDAVLHLVHAAYLFDPIFPASAATAAPGTEMAVDLAQAVVEAARQRLEPLARKLAGDGFIVQTHVEVGAPSAVVVDVARRVEAGVIVLATRGLSGFRHAFLGSTTERVVQHAAMPVLSVHATDGAAARPLRHILLPTDFSAGSLAAIDAARQVCRLPEGAHVHLLHVFEAPADHPFDGAHGVSSLYHRHRDQVLAEVGDRLERTADPLRKAGLTVETEVVEGAPAAVIVDRAAELGVDLVALGTHGTSRWQRLLLGSVARRVVQHAPCPVLTAHSHDSA